MPLEFVPVMVLVVVSGSPCRSFLFVMFG